MIRKALILVMALIGAYFAYDQAPPQARHAPASEPSNAALYRAIGQRESGEQVHGSGTVVRVLPDDNDGSRHQRFILELASGQTLLIAHNIDLAPRVPGLRSGDSVSFFGEYEWNERGGVIHWTHHDPRGYHVDGWLEYQGQQFK